MLKIASFAAALLALAPAVRAVDDPDTSTWVKFSSFTYAGRTSVTPKDGEYLNPIIAGFYPDPSICRVGEDYYLVNSSFNYFPGIPIWHSRDLVNWTQIGNVIDRPSQFPISGGDMSRGIYAPTIRYNKGTFYVANTLVGSSLGNYYVTATDPKGPWSDPIKLTGIGGIDPDLFFDDDGKCYVISCDDPAQVQYNGHRAIKLQELNLLQKRPVGEKTIIINGGTDISQRPVWCEGPHIYKVNGKYYAMCAQGGTGTAHTEVIFRSDSVRGPYVPWDKNPILTQMGLPQDRPNPVTCTGHADLIQTQNGEWFAVFLGCRPYQGGFYNTGRETFMLPVTWTDGWPVILPRERALPLSVKKPDLSPDQAAAVPTTGNINFTDNFDADVLSPRWIGIRLPSPQMYAINKSGKALFLNRLPWLLSSDGSHAYLGVRQQNNDFSVSVTLTAQPETWLATAGLAAFQNETHYYAINVKIETGRLSEISVERPAPVAGQGPGRGRGTALEPASQPASAAQPALKLPDNLNSIELKIQGDGPILRCFYKTPNGEFTQLGQDLPSSFLSTDVAGGFQGVTLGMFAHIAH